MASKTYTVDGQSRLSAKAAVHEAQQNLQNRLLSDGYEAQGRPRVVREWVVAPNPRGIIAEDHQKTWHAKISVRAVKR